MDGREIEKPMVIEEVTALIRYASEGGIDPSGKTIGPLYESVEDYNSALEKDSEEKKIKAVKEILRLYSELTALTSAQSGGDGADSDVINGRTLLDTKENYRVQSWKILFWSLVSLVLALGTEALDLWFADIVKPEEGKLLVLLNIHRYFLDNFSPFFWGALGSCVFLMKRISDKAAKRCFDSRRWRGWTTRILLGAILGTVVVYIYDPGSFTEKNIDLDANAVAFFTGVGVRVIYGGIEKTINVLAQKFNIGNAAARTSTAQQTQGGSS